MDQDSGIRAAFLAAFVDRIKERTADGWYVSVLKETTIHDKEAAVKLARDRLKAEAEVRPGLAQDELLVELMKREMRCATWASFGSVVPAKFASNASLPAEISEGFEALAEHRGGKRTLRTHEVQDMPAPAIPASELIALRESRHLSRPVFARYLRTNPRTLENWEQGRARPNAQAALLIRLVQRFPDTVDRLASV